MAKTYDQLPVYIAVYELLLKTMEMTKHVPREFRFTLCEDINKGLIRVLTLVRKANRKESESQRLGYLTEAMDDISDVEVELRVLHDMKSVSTNLYAQIAFDLVEAEKQIEKWQGYIQGKQEKSNSTN